MLKRFVTCYKQRIMDAGERDALIDNEFNPGDDDENIEMQRLSSTRRGSDDINETYTLVGDKPGSIAAENLVKKGKRPIELVHKTSTNDEVEETLFMEGVDSRLKSQGGDMNEAWDKIKRKFPKAREKGSSFIATLGNMVKFL